MVLVSWLAACGILFALVVLLVGAPILPSLVSVLGLGGLLLWLWSRETVAEPLSMNESLWNTPEDEEEELDVNAR